MATIIDKKTGEVVAEGYVFRRRDYKGRVNTYRLDRVGVNTVELVKLGESSINNIILALPAVALAQYGLDVSIF